MEQTTKKLVDHTTKLGTEPVGSLLLKQSLPAVIGILVMGLYNVADAIFISRGVGLDGLAGVTVAFPVLGLLMALTGGIGIGGASVISRRLGAQKKEEAYLAFGNIVSIILHIGVLGIIIGLFFIEKLLLLFGTLPVIMPYASDYLSVILFGSIFFAAGMSLTNVVRSEGNAKMAMLIMLSGAILNVIFTPIFIFVFGWGVKGAALGTVLAQVFAVLILIAYFVRGSSSLVFSVKNMIIVPQMAKEIILVGLPTFARQGSGSILFIAANYMLFIYGGELAVAVLGIVYRILMFAIMPVFGIAQGMQPIIGYNYGASNLERVMQTIKLAMKWASVLTVSVFIIIMLFPEQLIKIFTPDTAAIKDGVVAMRIIFAVAFLTGIQMVAGGLYQAIGMPFQALLITLSRQIIFLLPIIFILPRYIGYHGVWWAFPIAELLGFLLAVFFLYRDLSVRKILHQST